MPSHRSHRIASLFLACIVAFTFSAPVDAFARPAATGETATIIATPKSDTSAVEIKQNVDDIDNDMPLPVDLTMNPLASGDGGRLSIVKTDEAVSDQVITDLESSGLYQCVDVRHEYAPLEISGNEDYSTTPNDPFFAPDSKGVVDPGLWGLRSGWGSNFCAVWSQLATAEPPSSSASVAVIDTGFTLSHPDRGSNIVAGWNYGTASATGNGNVDSSSPDLVGVAFANHGTFVAGIISAGTNNGQGIASATWDSPTRVYKVLDSNGNMYTEYLVRAINKAVADENKVINISLGTIGNDKSVEAAVNNARAKGVIVVAASGNSGTSSSGGAALYPAANAKTLSVGAIDSSGKRSTFSTYNNSLDLVAPGQSVLSLVRCNSRKDETVVYGVGSGTSYAAPFVSSACALLMRLHPSLTADQIEAIVRISAHDITSTGVGWDMQTGWGALDMKAANELAQIIEDDPTALPSRVGISRTTLTSTYGTAAKPQLKATAYKSNGEAASVAASIRWLSSDTSVATVSSSGVVTMQGTGRATISATTANNKTATCSITVKPSKIAKPAAKSRFARKLTVSWKTTSSSGYQVQVAQNSRFTKGKKGFTATNPKTKTKTFTKLASKKKYYVRVRAYKISGSTKLYGAWSAVRTIRVK